MEPYNDPEELRRAYEQNFPALKWRRRRKDWPPVIVAFLAAYVGAWLLLTHLRWTP